MFYLRGEVIRGRQIVRTDFNFPLLVIWWIFLLEFLLISAFNEFDSQLEFFLICCITVNIHYAQHIVDDHLSSAPL